MKGRVKSFFAAVGYSFLCALLQGIVSIIIIIPIVLSSAPINNFSPDNITNLIAPFMNYILMASSIVTMLTLWIIFKCRKLNLKEEILLKKTKSCNIIGAIILGFFAWIFNSSWVGFLQTLDQFKEAFNVMDQMLSGVGSGNIFVAILVVGIIAPIAEEFIFRGVIYRALKKNMSIVSTIIIQAILFGIFHGNLIQGMYTIPLALVLGYVTYRTNSLLPAIMIHIVNNTAATVMPMFLTGVDITMPLVIILFILGLLGVILPLRFIIKKNPKKIDSYTNINTSVE
ncbi:CPBP family intramembrane glutamic endopeptidase [Clostridium septicum]|uniref:CPBP family intramembrane metalloprotease n=1 Tax=Clostridium septicum TaxID=1504 RepID=A0A9N7PK40_CLOSE|nr:CPBP family intramembrane glutamic endopeptidase [Clostridium septicum]AYE35235.1 CPBP family intramembrane metalloprotease [Clostridium septicum]QAS60630.1 CPBP family intramembrane metalloprotease [Clostridium septicum]UEC20114.1 CPBP family intramembrane metalloprotease [Clostridium septicum]USS01829.1 CPBP family intramembrane metalloprotease [Clostridium septicum]